MDPIGPDNAVPDGPPEPRLDGNEAGSGAIPDSAGSLLSIKVRRRMSQRPRIDAKGPPDTHQMPAPSAERNGHEPGAPVLSPAGPPDAPAAAAADMGARDGLLGAGSPAPGQPEPRRPDSRQPESSAPPRRRPDDLVTYWSHLRAGRHFPALADIDLGRIAADWPNSLMIRRRTGSRVLEAERIGGAPPAPHAARSGSATLPQIDLSPLMLQWLLSLAGEVTKTKRPMGDTESFPSLRKSVRYRAFALPLSDDQKEIDHILCHVCLDE